MTWEATIYVHSSTVVLSSKNWEWVAVPDCILRVKVTPARGQSIVMQGMDNYWIDEKAAEFGSYNDTGLRGWWGTAMRFLRGHKCVAYRGHSAVTYKLANERTVQATYKPNGKVAKRGIMVPDSVATELGLI